MIGYIFASLLMLVCAPVASSYAQTLVRLRSVINPNTITAASCSRAHVQAAIDNPSVTTGWTVNVPAGTCDWGDALLNIEFKAITLKGAGIGQTIIRDTHTGNGIPDSLISVGYLIPGQTMRITGFEFQDAGTRPNDGNIGYIIIFWGAPGDLTGRFRFDHNKLDHMDGFALRPFGAYGLIDHNTIVFGGTNIPIYMIGDSTLTYEDDRWAEATNWGSNDFLFVEDNTFTYDSSQTYACIDAYGGARFVFRHNVVTRGFVSAHGTESAGRFRGTRAIEVYENTFTGNDTLGIYVDLRSGSALIYNNTGTGYTASPKAANFINDRSLTSFTPWSWADGMTGWDNNDAGNPFDSRTATSGTGLTVTVSGAGWVPDHWIGYNIKKTTSGDGPTSLILSNTATVITFSANIGGGFTDLSFTGGDTFQINRVIEVLDQPGRSGGADLNGVLTPSVPGGWAQVDDPIYVWNNTEDGGAISASPPSLFSSQIRLNEHYFLSAAPGYTAYTYPHPASVPP